MEFIEFVETFGFRFSGMAAKKSNKECVILINNKEVTQLIVSWDLLLWLICYQRSVTETYTYRTDR